ncbi:MAG TPA: S8 family serine peptidase [Solirubrobacterales bacterium]|nr:S8 family serine peptidase [Solirubrobacterales bacterium]
MLRRRNRRGAAAALAVAALAVALLATAASAKPLKKANGGLSPVLATLAKPSVRALPPQRRAKRLGVAPSGPGSLLRKGGRVLTRVSFDHGALHSRAAIQATGSKVLRASRRAQSATVAVAPADLEALAAIPTVVSVTPLRAPVFSFGPCEGGSVVSEGVTQLNAQPAREQFTVEGSGVTVGVLSDSFNKATEAALGGPIATHAQEDVETENLPGAANECVGQEDGVDVLEDFESPESTDEGRGMEQIVHDMAPGASLAFATAYETEEDFASNIEALASAGNADVIVDDVGYFEEPFFQDGPVAKAVNKVSGEGVTYLSSAGNDNLFDGEGNEIASWEAPEYRDSGGCPHDVAALAAGGFKTSHCLDFNPGAAADRTFGIKVEAGEVLSVDLQWAEPWEGVETDLDAFLLNAEGELIALEFTENEKTGRPLEILQWINESAATQTVQLVVNRYSGPGARLKFILLENGGGVTGIEYPKSGSGDVVGPSIYGHAGSASAIAVGAVPFNNSAAPEPYSSRGPVTHYFEEVTGTTTPAVPIPGGEVLSKPDVAATDCGQTTFFAREPIAEPGIWRFCGTSAAAPHAAGAVALMRQAAPLASPALLRESLLGTGSPVGLFTRCAVGGGLVETVKAVEAAREEFIPSPPGECEAPESPPGEVFVAPGEWGRENPPVVEPPPPPPPPPPPSVTPETAFAKHPKAKLRIHAGKVTLVFRFRSDQSGVTFLCKVDKAAFHTCGAKLSHAFKPGKHVVKVKARSAAGLVDPTPAVFRFRVERVR